MIRSLIAIIGLLTVGSVSFAAGTCDKLVLACDVSYVSNTSGMVIHRALGASEFADENQYEPSLANCASTVYVSQKQGEQESIVKFHAIKDLESDQVALSVLPIQQGTKIDDGQAVSSATYGTEAKAISFVGARISLNGLNLAEAIVLNNEPVSQVNVSCVAK
jgi:hypothetical protein